MCKNDTLNVWTVNEYQSMEAILTEPKILVLILAIDKDPWKTIEIAGQGRTWKSSCPSNIEIVRYIGAGQQNLFWKSLNRLWRINQKIQTVTGGKISLRFLNRSLQGTKQFNYKINQDDKEIITTVPDLYSLIGMKTIEAFAASIDNFDFDFIYRTNVSSYVDLSKLNEFIKNKPQNGYYGGAIGDHQGIKFASGCGYFLSRDVVNKVLENRGLWDHNLIDDVSLGKLLIRELNIEVQEVERIDLDTLNFNSVQINSKSQNIFHYRCKAPDPDVTIQIMKSLHAIVGNN
jgi:hypothetical protein